jgi:hypothetical protein
MYYDGICLASSRKVTKIPRDWPAEMTTLYLLEYAESAETAITPKRLEVQWPGSMLRWHPERATVCFDTWIQVKFHVFRGKKYVVKKYLMFMNSYGEMDWKQVCLASSSYSSMHFWTVDGASQISCKIIYFVVILIIILISNFSHNIT